MFNLRCINLNAVKIFENILVNCFFKHHLLSADQYDPEVKLGHLRRFSLKELKSATENFSAKNILGKGGFGIVYRGKLPDGTIVAVKRLKDCNAGGGEVQFQTEVEMISLAIHRNLLRLVGFCSTHSERLLVYPYMANGSVASQLRGNCLPVLERERERERERSHRSFIFCCLAEGNKLDWGTRKRIAVGTARGLAYLHEQCDPKIIHRDVKAANILLGTDFEAVVGDFGLAKLLDHADSHVTTAVRGTVGHIAPEYLSTGQSSDKTDVFGFGMLLLELVSGQKALDLSRRASNKGALLDWVRPPSSLSIVLSCSLLFILRPSLALSCSLCCCLYMFYFCPAFHLSLCCSLTVAVVLCTICSLFLSPLLSLLISLSIVLLLSLALCVLLSLPPLLFS